MADVRIPDEALAWIAALASNASHLPLVTEVATKLGPQLTRAALRRQFAQESGLPSVEAARVTNGLMNLLHSIEKMEQSAAEIIEWVTGDLEKNAPPDWQAQHLPAWKAAAPALAAALDPDGPLAILHKTLDLTTAHENVWQSAQVFTDIRPVFSSDATRILRAVVTHMLAVSYHDARSEEREMYFALDSTDIRRLHAACERALTKVKTVWDPLESTCRHASLSIL